MSDRKRQHLAKEVLYLPDGMLLKTTWCNRRRAKHWTWFPIDGDENYSHYCRHCKNAFRRARTARILKQAISELSNGIQQTIDKRIAEGGAC